MSVTAILRNSAASSNMIRTSFTALPLSHSLSRLNWQPVSTSAVSSISQPFSTYRGPKTVRSSSPVQPITSTVLSSASSSSVIIIARRGYFWNKKDESAASGMTTSRVVSQKEIPEAESEAVSAPDNSKASRLGFNTGILDRLAAAWPHIKTYSVWVGVGFGILLVFKGGLNIIDFFATVNFLNVGEAAFVAGLVSGLGVIGCGWLGTRFLRLRPEPIFQHALKRISNDSTVVQYMGSVLTPGAFRAYSFVPGTVRMTQEQRDRATAQSGLYKYWQPKRLQLFFQISGSNGTLGMVSAEVEKNWKGDHTYNLLSVDLDTKNGERIVLEGDVNYKIYKGIIKLR